MASGRVREGVTGQGARGWRLGLTVMALSGVATGLSGCSGGGSGGAATTPPERPAEARAADPSAGIVRYQTYSAIVVGQGDTVSDLARRAGVDQQALASYNGIEVTTQLRPGDELVLPPG